MNLEMTSIKEIGQLKGWVLYDGSCALCCRWARRAEPLLTRRDFDLAPLQEPWVQECFDLAADATPTEMRVVTTRGESFGGADALLHLAAYVWWAWPLCALAVIPGVRPLWRAAYRFLAARRHCGVRGQGSEVRGQRSEVRG